MMVHEYLRFFSSVYGIRGADAEKAVAGSLDLTGLDTKADALCGNLSRGMSQRLHLARVLLHDPKVLLLDEPAAGLDPRARVEFKDLVVTQRRIGKTLIISSHILTELADCCTSIGIIERGQLLLHGPINVVYRQIQRNRHIEVRFTNSIDAGVSLIRSDPKVRNVHVDTRSCTVELDGEDADVQRLLRQLVTADCGLLSFAEKEPTLEDVFMLVTKGLVT
jgi:ABC-2 type transport system ATP-binding protein